MISTTWILVAHRAGARIYSVSGKHQPLQLVENISHPEGRLRNQDLDTDSGGRNFDSFGNQRHTMGAEIESIDHVADQFAKQLAEKLRVGRINDHYQHLTLVAGPRLLGKLRLALDTATAKLITEGLDTDFGEISDYDLPGVLSTALNL